MGDEIVKVKGKLSAEGVEGELAIGDQAISFLDRLMPGRSARARITAAATDKIVEKIRTDAALSPAEVSFATAAIGGEAAKYVRREEVAQRARVLATQEAQLGLPAGGESTVADPQPAEATTKTAEDWISMFWEDAGLVSDELMQEIYARLLVGEASKPGMCSMRTLRTLRYLDPATAQSFLKIVPLVLGRSWVPGEIPMIAKHGVSYGLILDLDEAGLISSDASVVHEVRGEPEYLNWGTRVIRLSQNPPNHMLPMFQLTRAGRELCRIAQAERSEDYFRDLLQWLATTLPPPGPPPFGFAMRVPSLVAWAEMPHARWVGPPDQLTWTEVPRGKAG